MNARTDIPLGVVPNLPAEQYHAIHALSAGGLRRLRKTPRHFFAKQLDPMAPHGDPTPAMVAGTLAHCALLEPRELTKRYAIKPEGYDGRTKEGKAWKATVSPGVEIIEEAQLITAQRQSDAVRELPEIASLMKTGGPEVSCFWLDDETGELCKCRPDWVTPAGPGVIIMDLKTCPDASPFAFARKVADMAYHLQAAWYADGYEKASGRRVLGFVFAAVESEYPHAAAAYMLDDDAMARAREENAELLRLYARCKAANDWPGYPSTIQPLSLPSWA